MEIVLRDVESPGDAEGMASAFVARLGFSRRKSSAKHEKLLMELMKMRKKNIPLSIDEIARIMGVSKQQAYHELKKWKDLGLVESVKIPAGDSYMKGYMLSAPTLNRAVDKLEYRLKAFVRKTRMMAKELDDFLAVSNIHDKNLSLENNEKS